jgi:hypothetical protein
MALVQPEKWFAMFPTLRGCIVTEKETSELIVVGSVKQERRARVGFEKAFEIARQTVVGSNVRSIDHFHCRFFRTPGFRVCDFHAVFAEDVLDDVGRFVIRNPVDI